MVNVMGQTPEDAMRILQERIDEAQRQAQGARDFVEALQKARITGHDSRSEIEVEVNSDGRMVNIEIDEQALEGQPATLSRQLWKPMLMRATTCANSCVSEPQNATAIRLVSCVVTLITSTPPSVRWGADRHGQCRPQSRYQPYPFSFNGDQQLRING